jgi:tyrosinase
MRLSTLCSAALLGTSFVAAAPAAQVGQPIAVDMPGMITKYKSHIDSALSKKDGNRSNKVCKHSTVTVRKEW